jgi:hypothetical protein
MIDESTFLSGGDSGCVHHGKLSDTKLMTRLYQINMLVDHAEEETRIYASRCPWVYRDGFGNRGSHSFTTLDN